MSRSIRVLFVCSLLVCLAGVLVAQPAEEMAATAELVPAPPPGDVPQGAPTQAVLSWTGGSQFGIFYGGSTGDVVGFRFMMSSEMAVESLGVWNGDTQVGFEGLSSNHMVGIWDDTMTLITSATVTPTSTLTGDFRYEAIAPVVLSPGTLYTIGAEYTGTDNDSYVSGASGLVTDPDVTWVNAVFPSATSLGFVYPENDSAPSSQGRFGPNFIFGPPAVVVPVVEIPTLGTIGLMVLLLGLGFAATMVLRRRTA